MPRHIPRRTGVDGWANSPFEVPRTSLIGALNEGHSCCDQFVFSQAGFFSFEEPVCCWYAAQLIFRRSGKLSSVIITIKCSIVDTCNFAD